MLLGLHHVTAIAGDAQRNLDFYTRSAGMRLVKRTVNFDDPASHHLYFSTGDGAPGTLLTFFVWGRRGTRGSGQIEKVVVQMPVETAVNDPDNIGIEFVKSSETPRIQSVTLCEADAAPTVTFLRDVLELRTFVEDRGGVRFALPDGACLNVRHSPDTPRGKSAAGIIHHLALRVAEEKTQLEWRERLIRAGFRVSPVKNRLYFHSIYFREPGGVLFEIATDGPGFSIDEPAAELGRRLCLPPWLEPVRESIERRLTPLVLEPSVPPKPLAEADGR
jgi:glyoxalase family protein